MELLTNPQVEEIFENYPPSIQTRILNLRALILETASEVEGLSKLEETLKWGEPSYLAKRGSTIRIDWKEKTPDQYAMYFKCTSKLVPTFREVYGDLFKYEKNRAIVFDIEDELPQYELKECIRMALQYHTLKNLPRLGA